MRNANETVFPPCNLYSDSCIGASNFENQAAGQRFTVDTSGILTTMEVTIDTAFGGDDLIVSIHESDGAGFPGALIATTVIPEAMVAPNIVNDGLSVFDLSDLGVALQANVEYVATFQVEIPNSGSRYRAFRTAINVNSFGFPSLFSRDGGIVWENSSAEPEIGMTLFVANAGDLNGDGVLNLLDVGPFIDALGLGTYVLEPDTNFDGVLNLLDVGPFIDLLGS